MIKNLIYIFIPGNKQKHFFGLRKKKSLSTTSGGGGASSASRSSTLTSMTSQMDNYSTHRSVVGSSDGGASGGVDPDLLSIAASCATLSGELKL
jgi:hypothetical protein